MDTLIGRTLKHYQVEENLGQGGMGIVYRALDTKLQRPVAIKLLRPDVVADADRRSRFLQEARSAAALTHPAIAQVYDIDEADGVLFIAMEFIDGRTVGQLIAAAELDLMGAVEIALQIAEGLARAHAIGLIHRDIKSDNIMVTRDGHAKLLDFGLAKLFDAGIESESATAGSDPSSRTLTQTMTQTMGGPAAATRTMAGTVRGTINYMSPEQARGRALSPASDVFSLGIVLYEMVIGERPFKGETPLDTMHSIAFEEPKAVTIVRRNMPVQLHRIISRCLRKKPEDRYPDAHALADDLKHLKRDLESGTRESLRPVERLRGWVEGLAASFPLGRNGLLILAAAVLGSVVFIAARVQWGNLFSLALFGWLFYRWIHNRRSRRLRAIIAKMAKDPSIRAILLQGERITIVVDRATAATNIRITSLVDAVNKRLYFGAPVRAEIKAEPSEAEYQVLLKTPGIVYAREETAALVSSPPLS
jgi:eukaryotic-like serine/threonine-protein kinase